MNDSLLDVLADTHQLSREDKAKKETERESDRKEKKLKCMCEEMLTEMT